MFYSVVAGFSSDRPSKMKFLELLKAKAILGYNREKIPAYFCAFDFKYGAKDARLIADMQEFFIQDGIANEAEQLFVIP